MARFHAALLALLAVACGSSTEGPQPRPVVWSWSTASSRAAELRFLLPTSAPNCQADSVSVTGPGLPAPLPLTCSPVTGADAFRGTVDLWGSGLLPPLTYTFTATLGGKTATSTATVDCYLGLPVGVGPSSPATSPVTLSWSRPSATGSGASGAIQYDVAVSGPTPRTVSLVDQLATTFSLTAGSYSWGIAAVPVGLHDGSSPSRTSRCASRSRS